MSVDDDIDQLYSLPLEEFVPARDALAKLLRADKHRAEADAVKSLRKPNVAAWTLNQLVRAHPAEIDELLSAGDALRAAQTEAISGGGPGALRLASVRQSKAIRALLDRAPTANVQSLRSASIDSTLGSQLRTGRLTRELAPADPLTAFDAPEFTESHVAAPPLDEISQRRQRNARDGADAQAERQREQHERAQRQAAELAERQQHERISAAEARVAAATLDVARAQQELQAARSRLRAAEELLNTSRKQP